MSRIQGLLQRSNIIVLAGAITILVFVFAIGGSIAGSYALTLATVHHTQQQILAAENLAKQKAIEQEIVSAKGTCGALVTLDNAKNGIVFKPSDNGASSHYLKALIKGIDGVVTVSHCRDLLDGNYHIANGEVLPGKR